VSMGMIAANKLLRVVTNTRNVFAIEALAVAQALDFLAPEGRQARPGGPRSRSVRVSRP
jgi:histidine ammonia-lyase